MSAAAAAVVAVVAAVQVVGATAWQVVDGQAVKRIPHLTVQVSVQALPLQAVAHALLAVRQHRALQYGG